MNHFKKMLAFTSINFIPKIFTTQKMENFIRNKHGIFLFSVLMETLTKLPEKRNNISCVYNYELWTFESI